MVTLDYAIETVMQLPLEQQEMLLEILHQRHVAMRREEIARDAQQSLAAFRAGEHTPQSASEIIQELRRSLEQDES